jgi:hypothetical protein
MPNHASSTPDVTPSKASVTPGESGATLTEPVSVSDPLPPLATNSPMPSSGSSPVESLMVPAIALPTATIPSAASPMHSAPRHRLVSGTRLIWRCCSRMLSLPSLNRLIAVIINGKSWLGWEGVGILSKVGRYDW